MRWSDRRGRDRGSSGVQFAAGVLPLLMVLLLVVALFRVGKANLTVGAAAYDAARTASLARTPGQAQAAAQAAAAASLTQQGLRCVSQQISVDTGGFTVPVGQVAAVTATVSCTVSADDLSYGIGGTRTLTGSATSALDTYRERQ